MNLFAPGFSTELTPALAVADLDFPLPLAPEISRDVAAALAEDVGAGDLTASLIPAERRGQATVIAREPAVLCGRAWFEQAFRVLDPTVSLIWSAADGDRVEAGQE